MELLNLMLTSTVSSLFTDRQKHIKYFISEESGVDRTIPKSSTRKELESLKESVKESRDLKEFVLVDKSGKSYDCRAKLQNSLNILRLSEKVINEGDLTYKTLEFLENEKKKVKKELQNLDNDFLRHFGRNPEKNEKEAYRLIYVYYKNLKNAIEAKKTGKSQTKKKNDQVNINLKETNKRPQSHSNSEIKLEDKNRDSEIKRSSSYKNKEYNQSEINEFKNELSILMKQQEQFKVKLHDYQIDFLKKNNRKVKYYRDIIEVEYEYNKYKENRQRIREIEDIIISKRD